MAKLKMRNLEAELLSKGIVPEQHTGTINTLEVENISDEEEDEEENEEEQKEMNVQK